MRSFKVNNLEITHVPNPLLVCLVKRYASPLHPRGDDFYEWHLTEVERVKTFRKPRGHPQPVWFKPF